MHANSKPIRTYENDAALKIRKPERRKDVPKKEDRVARSVYNFNMPKRQMTKKKAKVA
jgi:nucleoside 2-deoxyribosyltransferase